MRKDLNECYPLWDVEEDVLLSKQGDVTLGFQVELPELFSMDARDYETLHQSWVKAIKSLPAGCLLHKQDWFVMDKVSLPAPAQTPSFLTRSSDRFFAGRPYLAQECYLYITCKPRQRRAATSLWNTLLKPCLLPQQTLDPEALSAFEQSVQQFRHELEQSGWLRLRKLTRDDYWSTAHRPGLVERYWHLAGAQDAPQIKEVTLKPKLRVGSQATCVYTLAEGASWPARCGVSRPLEAYSSEKAPVATGLSSVLGQLLPCNHIYNQYLVLESDAQVLQGWEQQRLRLQALSQHSRENQRTYASVQAFLDEAFAEGRRPVRAHINVLCWAPTEAELQAIKPQVVAAFQRLEAVAKEETVIEAQLFWAGLPGNAAELPREETVQTLLEPVACWLMLERSTRTSLSPVGLRLGERLTGYPLHVDLSDEPREQGHIDNRNKFIVGPSGSGKSFFTNHLVRSYYEQGAHIVLVDIGHSYAGLCELVQGYYFTYTSQAPLAFNPFYGEPGQPWEPAKMELLKGLLGALWKKQHSELSPSEYTGLSSALRGYARWQAAHPDVFPCFNRFYEYLFVEYASQVKNDPVQTQAFDLDNLLYVLRPFYQGGEFEYLLNAETQLDLVEQRLIIFELSQIQDHRILLPVVTLMIMEVFMKKLELQGVRKILLIEEAWKAIAREGMGEYIRYVFKTVRKSFGEAIVVTQEIDDIISSPIVKQAILANADCKILLGQFKQAPKMEQLQQLLGLTEKQKAQVMSLNKARAAGESYKEVFISLGSEWSNVYRVQVSPTEYLCYTTEEREKMQVTAYARRYGSFQQGLAMLAAERRDSTTLESP